MANQFADSDDPFKDSSSYKPYQNTNESSFTANANADPFSDPANEYGGSATSAGANTGFGPAPVTNEELARREAALKAQEEALNRRQTELTQREADLGLQANNWPPFFPILHQDISTLPALNQRTIKHLYIQWLALIVTLIINLVGCILLLVSGSSDGGADTAASGSYVAVIGVLSFITWYRPLYLGFKKTDGRLMAFFVYMYLFFGGWHLLFSIYMAIGIPSTGSAGLINTISSFSQSHILAGVFGAIASAGWIVQAAGGGLIYKQVWDFKNGDADINFAQATSQFKNESIKNVILHQSRM